MDVEQIEQLYKILGCTDTRYRGTWINAACPFSSWRHRKGTDKRPSFGVSVAPGCVSRFRCFSCGVSGDLPTLLWSLRRFRKGGSWFEPAAKLVMEHEHPSLREIELRLEFADNPDGTIADRISRAPAGWAYSESEKSRQFASSAGGRKALRLDHLEYPILPEKHLAAFKSTPPEVLDYLTGPRRKLEHTTIALWELGWQPHKRRIVIPMRDWDGKLVAITGRCLDVKRSDGTWEHEQEPKFLHSKGFKRDYFLFGEHLVARGEPGMLVEGHFDAMYLRQMGYPNTVAVMGSYLSQVQVEKILTMFSEVTIFPDGDEAGGLAAEKWEHSLKGRTEVKVLTVRTGYDPDNYDDEELLELMGFDYQDAPW
jgi:hypothetical protein